MNKKEIINLLIDSVNKDIEENKQKIKTLSRDTYALQYEELELKMNKVLLKQLTNE